MSTRGRRGETSWGEARSDEAVRDPLWGGAGLSSGERRHSTGRSAVRRGAASFDEAQRRSKDRGAVRGGAARSDGSRRGLTSPGAVYSLLLSLIHMGPYESKGIHGEASFLYRCIPSRNIPERIIMISATGLR